jgi:hypothetical protein
MRFQVSRGVRGVAPSPHNDVRAPTSLRQIVLKSLPGNELAVLFCGICNAFMFAKSNPLRFGF